MATKSLVEVDPTTNVVKNGVKIPTAQLSDATTVGKSVVTATTAAAARSAIGALDKPTGTGLKVWDATAGAWVAAPTPASIDTSAFALKSDQITLAAGSGIGIDSTSNEVLLTAQSMLGGRTAFFGDSITMYGEAYPYYAQLLGGGAIHTVIAASNHGWASTELLGVIDAQIIDSPLAPTECVVMCGANDAQGAIPLATYSANIKAMVSKLQRAGITPILCTVTPHNNEQFNENVRLYNAWLRGWCRGRVALVDTHAAVCAPSGGWVAGAVDADGLHPTAAGSKLLGKAVADALRPITVPSPLMVSMAPGSPNLVPNSGFVTDTNADGIPDGVWTSNATMAVKPSGGINWLELTGDATTRTINSDEIKTGWAVGDKLRFSARIRSSQSTATQLKGLTVQVTCYNASYGVAGNYICTCPNGGISQQVEGVTLCDFAVPAGTAVIMWSLSNADKTGMTGETGTYAIATPSLLNLTQLGLA